MAGKMFLKLVVIVVAITAWTRVPATLAVTSGSDPSCLSSISSSCNSSGTEPTNSEINACCKALRNAVNNELACFCLLQPYVEDNAADTANVNALFTQCDINGTFDTLCPATGSTTPSGDTSDVPSTNDVPSTTPSSTSSSSGIGKGFGAKTNAGNKMATASISGLVIALISLMIMREI